VLVDTHTHLNFPQFDEDRHEAIARAHQAGVRRIVNVGTNLESSRAAADLARRTDGMVATAGFHPHDVLAASDERLEALTELMADEAVVAVGETGLDFFRDYAPRDVQERVFAFHIRLAAACALPLVMHSRGAEDRVMEILGAEGGGAVRGVLHCFGGTAAQAERAVEMGFFLGFGGTVTFKNADALSVAQSIAGDRLLLETDCPYLTPAPQRGRRNEPAFVRHVAMFLAERSGQDVEALARRTTENAERMFRLPAAA